jgi:hypothetical protein
LIIQQLITGSCNNFYFSISAGLPSDETQATAREVAGQANFRLTSEKLQGAIKRTNY